MVALSRAKRSRTDVGCLDGPTFTTGEFKCGNGTNTFSFSNHASHLITSRRFETLKQQKCFNASSCRVYILTTATVTLSSYRHVHRKTLHHQSTPDLLEIRSTKSSRKIPSSLSWEARSVATPDVTLSNIVEATAATESVQPWVHETEWRSSCGDQSIVDHCQD